MDRPCMEPLKQGGFPDWIGFYGIGVTICIDWVGVSCLRDVKNQKAIQLQQKLVGYKKSVHFKIEDNVNKF